MRQDIPLGFKIAGCNIATNESIVKYGVSIGSATRDIVRGDLVHLHNMKSDYLPTYTLDKEDSHARYQELRGYLRHDGRKGIRNYVAVCYLVECAHHVSRAIVNSFPERGVHLIGFGGCYPNAYASRMLRSLCTHPNVGAVLLVSLGCESFDRADLEEAIRQSGRPVDTLVIQQAGGTRKTIEKGRAWVESTLAAMNPFPDTPMTVNELVVGTVCGGSDSTSGITANPAIGRAFDMLTAQNATTIFEETGELIGCEHIMAQRAATSSLADELIAVVAKAAKYYATLEHGSFALGNAEGGLTTQEEKSMGAYSKSGSAKICGILKPGDVPPGGGCICSTSSPTARSGLAFRTSTTMRRLRN